MEKELEILMNGLTPSEAAEFDSSFGELGGVEVSADEQDRILSSVMRKAGYEMKDKKDNITVKRTKKSGKRIIVSLAAAAALATGAIGAGAYAYDRFFNKASVERFIDGADTLEENGYAVNQVVENEHIRITIDTVLSDGYNLCIVKTTEALDETGRGYLRDGEISEVFRYADTGEPLRLLHSSSYDETDGINMHKNSDIFFLDGVDTERDAEVIFYGLKDDERGDNYDEYGIVDGSDDFGYELTDRISLAKNCETRTLTDPDGREITLSNFEIVCDTESFSIPISLLYDSEDNMNPDYRNAFRLIRKDGTEEKLDGNNMLVKSGGSEGRNFISFGRYIDVDEYIGAAIGDAIFTIN